MSGRYGGDESKKDIHEANVEYLKNAVKPLCLPLRNRIGILFLAATEASLIQKIRFSEMFWG